ncbi:BLTX81-like protein [Dinothrombium tinctorium]|uniref:Mitochondrial fission 1 protein n=1 Tax=Dinothrombium tinctorium TaxID=1965070 RepID=A0A3S3PSI7_9ACAR|nr:BLTX81-like protein [Dinothrombium tinctorium]
MEALIEDDTCDERERAEFTRKYFDELKSGRVSNTTKFEYSWSLIRSKAKEDVRKGVDLLEQLCFDGDEDARRDYLFYLSIANTKLGDYQRALDCNEQFLSAEPNNYQAQELQRIIKRKMTKEGLQGLAIAGGAAAVIALGVGTAVIGGLVTGAMTLFRRR